MKRNLFDELNEGFDALKNERQGKITLKKHAVDMPELPAITSDELVPDFCRTQFLVLPAPSMSWMPKSAANTKCRSEILLPATAIPSAVNIWNSFQMNGLSTPTNLMTPICRVK